MIRKALKSDINEISKFATLIFENSTIEELEIEFNEFIDDINSYIVVTIIDELLVGFAQASLRYDYVEGTNSTPVGYLEGIYVLEEYRNQGHAKAMLKTCELWAKEKGCTQFASNCELNNKDSELFHKALGFQEVNRTICFMKEIK